MCVLGVSIIVETEDLYRVRSLKQQSGDRHVAPFELIILIPSQPVFALSFLDDVCLEEKQQIPIL
jgi:hypothetical protein